MKFILFMCCYVVHAVFITAPLNRSVGGPVTEMISLMLFFFLANEPNSFKSASFIHIILVNMICIVFKTECIHRQLCTSFSAICLFISDVKKVQRCTSVSQEHVHCPLSRDIHLICRIIRVMSSISRVNFGP